MKPSSLAILGIFVVAGGLFALRRCAPPPPPNDFTRAGNDGGKRPSGVNEREITVTVNPRGNSFTDENMDRLACGTPYQVLTVVSVIAPSCEGYDFTPLQQRASLAYHKRVDLWRCETGCSPIHSRVLFYKSECRNRRATISIKNEILCPRPDSDPPTVSAHGAMYATTGSTQSAVPGENGDMSAPSRRGELVYDISTSSNTTDTLGCPSRTVFLVNYNEYEPGHCASFGSYADPVKRAEQRSEDLLSNAHCLPRCNQQSLTVQRREWSCDPASSNIMVKIWSVMDCQP